MLVIRLRLFLGDFMWWEILKNAKMSGKAKGTTLSANRIKIKRPDDCCEEFWKTIQEFKNEHNIVVKVMGGKRFGENPFMEFSFDGITVVPNRVASFERYNAEHFDGKGHIYYKGDTLITPMSSKEPCKDSYNMFEFISDIWNSFINTTSPKEWDKFGYHIKGNMYPFLPKHYGKATLAEIREWPELVI